MEYLIIIFPICHSSIFSLNKKEFIEERGMVLNHFFPIKRGKKKKKIEGGNVQSTIAKEGTSLIVWTAKLADLITKMKSQKTKMGKDF